MKAPNKTVSEPFTLRAGVYRVATKGDATAAYLELERMDCHGNAQHVATLASFTIAGGIAGGLSRAVREAFSGRG